MTCVMMTLTSWVILWVFVCVHNLYVEAQIVYRNKLGPRVHQLKEVRVVSLE